jgi:hypothetical protein
MMQAQALAQYHYAQNVANWPAQLMPTAIGGVLFISQSFFPGASRRRHTKVANKWWNAMPYFKPIPGSSGRRDADVIGVLMRSYVVASQHPMPSAIYF